ncbi:hydroxyacid dehydrogenase [Kibdelosporangium lantanae]
MLPRIAVALTPQRADDVVSSDTRRLIENRFDAVWAGDQLDGAELASLVKGSDVVLTSWGTPPLPAELWTAGDGPGVVAHAAGTVKKLVDPVVFEHGVAVFSAAGRIAWSVGEYCLGAILSLSRRFPRYDHSVRQGEWKPTYLRGHELRGRKVGILGASSTARALITLLKPFGCDVVVYDPYLDADRAATLGVRGVPLEEALACPIISIHVPNLPETVGMVSRDLIERMPDGTVVVNSSRGPAVDQAALLEHAAAGRLFAAMDVYDPEPPNLTAEQLTIPNLLLTPHIAGDSTEGHLALAGYVLTDVLDWLDNGTRGPSFVDPAAWATAA